MKNRIKLSKWAKNNDLSYQTAWNLIKAGKFPQKYIKLATGTILVEEETEEDLKTDEK